MQEIEKSSEDMTVSLRRLGNSKAIIIPSSILKEMAITENTVLDMKQEGTSIVISKTGEKRADLVFPKIDLPEITESMRREFFESLVPVPQEEIEADERLKYILEK